MNKLKKFAITVFSHTVEPSQVTHMDEKWYSSWMSEVEKNLLKNSDVVLNPHAVVSKDCSGQYDNITSALAAYPKDHSGRYVVYVKEGIYEEYVVVGKDQVNVFMFGDGATKTIMTGNRSNKTGWATYRSATFCKCSVSMYL